MGLIVHMQLINPYLYAAGFMARRDVSFSAICQYKFQFALIFFSISDIFFIMLPIMFSGVTDARKAKTTVRLLVRVTSSRTM
jgi:hypothetical protein